MREKESERQRETGSHGPKSRENYSRNLIPGQQSKGVSMLQTKSKTLFLTKLHPTITQQLASCKSKGLFTLWDFGMMKVDNHKRQHKWGRPGAAVNLLKY